MNQIEVLKQAQKAYENALKQADVMLKSKITHLPKDAQDAIRAAVADPKKNMDAALAVARKYSNLTPEEAAKKEAHIKDLMNGQAK